MNVPQFEEYKYIHEIGNKPEFIFNIGFVILLQYLRNK